MFPTSKFINQKPRNHILSTLFGILWLELVLLCSKVDFLGKLGTFLERITHNLRRYTEIHTPTVVQGGRGLIEPLLRGFENILPSVESP